MAGCYATLKSRNIGWIIFYDARIRVHTDPLLGVLSFKIDQRNINDYLYIGSYIYH